ncbi:MAG: DNA recombination protein RmuC [Sterolibacterium sp.]|nr:DNA recombination protein RmuC [Sterolibacterium sp.]
MNDILIYWLVAAVTALLAVLLAMWRIREVRRQGQLETEAALSGIKERLQARDEELGRVREQLAESHGLGEGLRQQLTDLRAREAELSTQLNEERRTAEEKLALIEAARQQLADQFKALSADALSRNNQSFLELARSTLEKYQEGAKGELDKRQQAIAELVTPVKTTLEKFEQQVQAVEKNRVEAYATLTEQVKSLAQSQGQLKQETANLVKALRAPQTRGRWGELQLKRVVEMAGMLDHCDFFEQESVATEEGQLRPDMIIRLPGGKNIVVDAKAPLAGYLDALEAQDDETRRQKLQDHARHVRDHLVKLGRKSYWEQFQPSPDLVVLFLPGEMFYSAALEVEPGLIEAGVEQKVILATPTTLIALLRAVAYGWKQEALADNAREISVLGKELYERLAVLADHWGDVGKHLGNAVGAYNKSLASLESRVLVSARKFRDLKAAPDRELRELAALDVTPRNVQAPELLMLSAADAAHAEADRSPTSSALARPAKDAQQDAQQGAQ